MLRTMPRTAPRAPDLSSRPRSGRLSPWLISGWSAVEARCLDTVRAVLSGTRWGYTGMGFRLFFQRHRITADTPWTGPEPAAAADPADGAVLAPEDRAILQDAWTGLPRAAEGSGENGFIASTPNSNGTPWKEDPVPVAAAAALLRDCAAGFVRPALGAGTSRQRIDAKPAADRNPAGTRTTAVSPETIPRRNRNNPLPCSNLTPAITLL